MGLRPPLKTHPAPDRNAEAGVTHVPPAGVSGPRGLSQSAPPHPENSISQAPLLAGAARRDSIPPAQLPAPDAALGPAVRLGRSRGGCGQCVTSDPFGERLGAG